jgi:simple sugar transport system permease protein
MMISGALIGLGGALMYLSDAGKYIKVVDVIASEGFDGIPVALLAMSHPIGVVFSAIFLAYLQVSGFYMQTYGFSPEIVDIIVSVIIYFSAFSLIIKEFVNKYRITKQRANSNKKVLEKEVER